MSEFVTITFTVKGDPRVMPTYTYKTHIHDLKVDEWVVVPVNDRFGVGRVVAIKPGKKERAKATRWIVGRIDFDVYNALTAMDPPPESVRDKTARLAAMYGGGGGGGGTAGNVMTNVGRVMREIYLPKEK